MVHIGVNKAFHSIHQGQFHGKERPGKFVIGLVCVVNDITHLHVDEKERVLLSHFIFLTPLLYKSWNSTPHYWYELTQFNSKFFRGVYLCSSLHVHDHNTLFCIILCAVTLPLIFTPHDGTTEKMVKGSFSRIQRTWIFSQFFFINGMPCFSGIFELFPSILSNSQASFNKYPDPSVKIIFKLSSNTKFIQ